jgi:glyoxalase family protein
VHHLALRTPTFADYDAWAERLKAAGYPNSGKVDRFYFRSLYLREPNGILIEIATDEPGFSADEPGRDDGREARFAALPGAEARADRGGSEAALEPDDFSWNHGVIPAEI